jgi:D-alanine-D-alanine ligase
MKNIVAVMFGGKSAEHEVSLKSASSIYNELDVSLFDKILVGVDREGSWRYRPDFGESAVALDKDYFIGALYIYLKKNGSRVDLVDMTTNRIIGYFHVAFPIIHGTFGEDGTLQGILRSLDCPFVGPDILGSAIGMDKEVAKRLLRDAGVPIARFVTVYRNSSGTISWDGAARLLGVPLFVKPANAGSSVGVSKVSSAQEFQEALSLAFAYDQKVLVEEAVFGKEIECAVMGNENVRASVLGEIVSANQFYSYEAKYNSPEEAYMQIPATIDGEVAGEIQAVAVKAFRVLCCEGLARVDFFLRENNTYVLNEINTLPGFTATSMYPKLWEKSGLQCGRLLTELIELAMARHQRDLQQI